MIEASKTPEEIAADQQAANDAANSQGNAGSSALIPPSETIAELDARRAKAREDAGLPAEGAGGVKGDYVSPTLAPQPEYEPRDEHSSKIRNHLHFEAILEHLCGRLGIDITKIRHPDEDEDETPTPAGDEAEQAPA